MRKSGFMTAKKSLQAHARICALCLCCVATLPAIATAQNASSDNWFQIEVTLFTYEDANLALENWSAETLSIGFPERLRRLTQVSELLQLSQWSAEQVSVAPNTAIAVTSPIDTLPAAPTINFGPIPYAPKEAIFTLPDFEREALLMLPAENHDFTGTNRALSQSADLRVLYHAAWRQVITRRASANAIAIMGGQRFQDRRELEGSLTFYLTGNADRVVLESNLWLNSFAIQPSTSNEWTLPVLPEMLFQTPVDMNQESTQYSVNRIIAFQQSRDIRSDEFHYLDHPAMGMLVQISSYTVPPMPLPPLDLPADTDAIPQ